MTLTHLASKGYQVVLAETEDVDVSHDDHLFVVFGKHSFPDYFCNFQKEPRRPSQAVREPAGNLTNLSRSQRHT